MESSLQLEGTQILSWRMRLARTWPTFVAVLVFSALVAVWLWLTWDPAFRTYLEYVPIAGVFAAFIWDRVFPSCSSNAWHTICDGTVLVLALMRVVVPPLPFISGHTLFATYVALTATRWPVAAVSTVVLMQVLYVKLFVSPGPWSMLGGLAAALALAATRATGPSPPKGAD